MHHQRGTTLIELVVIVAILSFALAITVVASGQWIGRESMRSGVSDMHSILQLAKIEAVSRNRATRFVVNTSSRLLEVWDTLGTDDTSDDERLHDRAVPGSVRFARPDTGDVVTMDLIDGTESYQCIFRSDGMIAGGMGAIYLQGGEEYGSVQVHAAGGVEIYYWSGAEWHVGF